AFLTAVLSTAGGIAFVGDLDRGFRAVDVNNGNILWETRLGTSVQGFPVTFTVGGKQYVAVTTGLGGGSPRQVPRMVEPDVRHPQSGNAIYVFALPDKAPLGAVSAGKNNAAVSANKNAAAAATPPRGASAARPALPSASQ